MTVYVDDPIWPFGRMLMCHMMADTREELDTMADRIGVQRKWIQHPGQWNEHYDIAKSKRALAIAAGAVEVDAAVLVKMRLARRALDRAGRDVA
ncbi:MAG TPA: DUF4031 domain-containing protein [Gaiellaceae bacterium]|nr:DUF4031 domain-containing protein [Gaiellaceae bacterium]